MGDITDFFSSFRKSRGSVEALIISVLLSFGLATTVGIVPTVIADRYARINHGWEGQPCYTLNHDVMPYACVQGGDDAQTGSACMSLVQNLLLFLSNPVVGSQSDLQGRRIFLLFGIFLFILAPAVLVIMQHMPKLNPFFYFAANSSTGLVSYMSIIFAAMADSSNPKYRAASFAMIMAGFYCGFCIAPSLVLFMNHQQAALLSWCLCVMAWLYAAACFPETLAESVAEAAAVHHAARTTEIHNNTATTHHQETVTISISTLTRLVGNDMSLDDSRERNVGPTTPLLSEEIMNTVDSPDVEGIDHRNRLFCDAYTQIVALVLLRPFREMSILYRNTFLRILTLASFLSAAVYSTDVSLVLFYIEEHLNVRDSDIAQMFFYMGILGVILQALGLQPLMNCLGEKRLLIISFLSGTLHNFLYGAARDKATITVALSFSQITKLNYPILSSLASKAVDTDEQGQVQGALLATNALAGALGPVCMNYIYKQTKNTHLGPGTMFLLASFLYFLGTLCVAMISMANSLGSPTSERREHNDQLTNDRVPCMETGRTEGQVQESEN
jgi:MFS family permease